MPSSYTRSVPNGRVISDGSARGDCLSVFRLWVAAPTKESFEFSPCTLQRLLRSPRDDQRPRHRSSLLHLVHFLHSGIDVILTEALPLQEGLALDPADVLHATVATATAEIQLFLVFVLFETACIMLRILPRELYWWTVGHTWIVPNRQVVFADLQIGEGYGPLDLLLVLGVGSLEAGPGRGERARPGYLTVVTSACSRRKTTRQ
mmetsp:Transcript_24665/g.57793  ORF Transcript_24665/g.57793 Transcript_24665/m.57793 type:complete len:205 (+) Transcript_24665:1151-1765(+)